MKNHKRAIINYHIKTRFQIRLLLRIVLLVLFGAVITSGVFYFYANQEIGATFKQFHINARNFLDYLLPAVLLSGLAGTLVAWAISIFLPLHFAGPLYRIEKDLEQVTRHSDLTFRFRVRKRDEHKELADHLNEMVETIRLKIERIEQASIHLSQLVSRRDSWETEEMKEAQETLSAAIGELKIHG